MDLIKKITETQTQVVVYGNANKGLSKGNPVIICFCNELPEIKDQAIKRRLNYGFN